MFHFRVALYGAMACMGLITIMVSMPFMNSFLHCQERAHPWEAMLGWPNGMECAQVLVVALAHLLLNISVFF
jgi:hypothetical protein